MTLDPVGLFVLLAGAPLGAYLSRHATALPLPDLGEAVKRRRRQEYWGAGLGLACAALAVASAPPGAPRLLHGACLWLLSVMAWSDMRTRSAPLWPAPWLAIGGLAKAYILLGAQGAAAFAFAGLATLGLSIALLQGFRRLRGQDGMGEADPPILAALACWLGFPDIAWTCAICAALGIAANRLLFQGFAFKLPLITLMALAAAIDLFSEIYV